MSKENMADNPLNKLNNFRNEDELLFDTSNSSKNLNSIYKLKLSNTHEKNNFKTSTMLTSTNDTSHKKIIGTNTVHDSGWLNKAETNFLIDKIETNETNLNSQDEKLLYKVVEKMNCNIFGKNTDLSDIDTQQYMQLHFEGALQQLDAFSQTLYSDSFKTDTIKQINSIKNDSTVISPLLLINELSDSEIKNENSIIANDPKKSEKINYPSPKIDHELSIRDHYVEYPGQDQDAEIIVFRAMCEALLKIGAIDNTTIDNNKTNIKKNNQLNKHDYKQVNHSIISCSNRTEYEPSTCKLNSYKGPNNISKRLAHKKHQINDLKFDSSDDSSPEYSNELSSKHNSKRKLSKITFSQNNLKINSNSYSDTTVIQPKNAKKRKLSDLTFEDKEVMLIENKLPKVQNLMNNLKCKKINYDDSLKQTRLLKENQTIFYFSTTGKVHNDMLNSIENKNCHSI